MNRIGEGYDIHRLQPGGPLRLGCADVPADVEAIGHSDGDALAHAVCDALMGAVGAGDIGQHFPAGDARWRGADSRVFLAEAVRLAAEAGYELINIDATIGLEKPKLAEHRESIRAALAEALGCDLDRVSVKAKTGEGLGPVGEGEAVEARAVVLLSQQNRGSQRGPRGER
jgi:2-C-methyl-D-erythritol 2,4-cyclodiphosphate synthase